MAKSRTKRAKRDAMPMWLKHWLATSAQVGRARIDVFLSTISMQHSNGETIVAGYVRSDKGLWDREPEFIVARLESEFPWFFDGYNNVPLGKDIPIRAKRAAVGRLMRLMFNDGKSKHKKPNLGKSTTNGASHDQA